MFRFLELELHGWDLWPPTRVPLDADVVILSGPNGSGKTTMLDAIRQILNAPRLSQNRRLAHYLRWPNQPALVRAVVSNKPDQRGRRPFELQRVFTDEATLACALVPNGGTPEKRFAVLPGRLPATELQRLLLDSRDWLAPERYRRVLEYAGVSRSLMHILALEQGRADELSRKGPRDLFKWVMEARGAQQVLERYNAARARYQDSLKEVERQQHQLVRYAAELERLKRLVRRLEEYDSRCRSLAEAEALLVGARLQLKLAESRDTERKLPDLRTKITNLTSTVDRLGREIAELESARENLQRNVQAVQQGFETLTERRDELIRMSAIAENKLNEARRQIADLDTLPTTDPHLTQTRLEDARQHLFHVEEEMNSAGKRIQELHEQIANLKQGIPVFPGAVQKTLTALAAARIPCSLAATLAEVRDMERLAAELPALETAFVDVKQTLGAISEAWKAADDERLRAERALDATVVELTGKRNDVEERQKESDAARMTVSTMELYLASLREQVQILSEQASDEMRVAADAGKLTISPEMADRDVKETRSRLEQFMAEEPLPETTVREEYKLVLHNIQEMEQHVFARQHEADAARSELDQCRGEYLQVIGGTLHDYRRRAHGLAEIARAKLEIEMPKLENTDKSIDEAGIVVRIGFDGKTPTEIGDTAHSGGQQVIAGLILLMAMAETEGDNFFIVDEPFAHLSLDRIDEVGRFLRGSGSQFLITIPTTLDRGQLDPASLLIVLGKKIPVDAFAPRPIVARV